MHSAQLAFRLSDALYRGYVGGIGSGKSWVGAYDLIRRAEPGRLYMVVAPTYVMLQDSSLRSFLALARDQLQFLRSHNRSSNSAVLGNGAEVLFRSGDDPERLRGPNLSGVWMDEASLMDRTVFDVLIGRLREGGEQGWLSATFTPKGRSHWTYAVFGAKQPDVELFHSRTADNPFLPPKFEATLAGQYTSAFAAQELGGEFVDLEGGICRREWFPIMDQAPAGLRLHRHWDLAATEVKATGSDPDWTAGALLGVDANRRFYLVHMLRARVGPAAIEGLVRQTAQADGRGVSISVEQEPGAGGKFTAQTLVRALAGFDARPALATGDKVVRAMPWLRQAEIGNLALIRGDWNRDFLDEAAAFPLGAHDDQADAVSGAFEAIAVAPAFGAVVPGDDRRKPDEDKPAQSPWQAFLEGPGDDGAKL